ncbi:MAG TPA: DUF448 domain-containing protein [Acidimicrobiales bacterium]|nr:DUF448 domain-containing protein [Acidimicrobiales bacterium]
MCRARRDDTLMVRAGRDAEARWYLGRGPGRGAWWCATTDCVGSLRASALARALRAEVSEADAQELREFGRKR